MNEHHSQPLLYTVSQTAMRLNISEKTVRRLISCGELPVVYIGSAVRIPEALLNQWIEDQTRYNHPGVELLPSFTGESLCNSLTEGVSAKCPTRNRQVARLDALLKPETNR